MTIARRRPPVEWCLLFGALLYGVWIYCLLPQGVTTLVDDFAYYRSVGETLQYHRPWTDDYLEPWSAGLSLLSAGIYVVTQSFMAATHGLIAACAAVAFWAFARLMRDRGFAVSKAIVLTALVLGFPMMLLVSINFLSWVLYLPCLYLGVRAAERGRWLEFALVWVVALSTRQTALFWSILPLAALWKLRRDPASAGVSWKGPTVALALGTACFVLCALGMNRTQAYEHLTKPQVTELVRSVLHLQNLGRPAGKFAVGICVLILTVGVSFWAKDPYRCLRGRYARILIGIAVAAVLFKCSYHINFRISYGHHRYLGMVVTAYLLLLTALGVVGLAGFEWSAVSWPLILTSLVGSAAISAHEPLQLVYLLEPAVLGFLAVLPLASPTSSAPVDRPRFPPRWCLLAPGVVVGICNFAVAVYYKAGADVHFADLRVEELAVREGKIDIGDAPRGLLALANWRLLPYLYSHPGPEELSLRPLIPRLRTPGGSMVLAEKLPAVFAPWFHEPAWPPPPGSQVLREESFRCGWFFHGQVVLYRLPDSGPPSSKRENPPADYHPQNFPLNDAEWREFFRHQPAAGFPRLR